jgi:DNA-binding MarR family transcriptional regulator
MNADPDSHLASVPSALGASSLVQRVARELSLALDRDLAVVGLTAQQAGLLLQAARLWRETGQPVSPSQLKDALGTDTAGMTRLLDRLEAKGLLRRRPHPADRRAIIIELTDEVRPLFPRVVPIFKRVRDQMWAGLEPEEVARVSAALRRMLDNLRGNESAEADQAGVEGDHAVGDDGVVIAVLNVPAAELEGIEPGTVRRNRGGSAAGDQALTRR